MCSTSRRSACTRATIAGCSTRWKSSATWATRCWWSSTTAKWSRSADQLLDFGPAAGEHGGQIVARGTPAQVAAQPRLRSPGRISRARRRFPCRRIGGWQSVTRRDDGAGDAKHAESNVTSETRDQRRRRPLPRRSAISPSPGGGWLEIIGARHNNLRNVDVADPAGHADRRHRRQRQRQELAGRGRAVQLAGPHAASRQDVRRRRTTPSAAWN